MQKRPPKKIQAFKTAVRRYYRSHKREMPWRNTQNPYKILVSEIMLQQTQVSRVLQKYPPFIKKFPDFETLAAASRRDVLAAWQGLGYNRRALLLKQCAEIVVREYGGAFPQSPAELEKLPGIGKATAGAIAAFACNVATPFIETNIRRVFIHFFFSRPVRGKTPKSSVVPLARASNGARAKKVHDEEILKLVEKTLVRKNPREWYYALMDYGAMLAKTIPNPNKKSASYARQPRFSGSDRELRGKILKTLIQRSPQTLEALCGIAGEPMHRVQKICATLMAEGFIRKQGRKFLIA